MKIAVLGLRLTVGVRLVIDTMGSALARRGHDVLFVGEPHTPTPPMRAIAVSHGASYRAMVAQTLSPAYHRSVVSAVVEASPDLCYFGSVHPAIGLLCGEIRRAAQAAGRRPPMIAVHIHDPIPHPGLEWPLIFAAQFLMARAADRVVVFGRTLAEQVARYYRVPRSRIVAVPLAVSRPPRSEPPSEVPCRHFSFLGRIDAYKGVEVFLAAARQLLERRPEARFFLGGRGSLRPYAGGIRALGNTLTVHNRELTNEETDQAMRSSWAAVLPYTSGTQSAVIPVAYWNACPVITTRVGALHELVSDREEGFLVAPRDPAAIAEKMSLLWGNTALRGSMGRRAFDTYDRTLRWDTVAGQLLSGLS